MKVLHTWQHAGLIVSASPLTSVTLAPAGVHGIHHVTVTAETAATAKALWARIQQGVLKPGIFAAYSEETEIDQEIHNAAQGRADTAGATAAHAIYIPQMDPKLIESRLRADPEMMKRTAAAQGQYDVRFRIDKPYRKVVVKWIELTGYSRTDGKAQGERALGQTAIAAPRMPPQAGAQLVARTRLGSAQTRRVPDRAGRRKLRRANSRRSTNAPTGSMARSSRNYRFSPCLRVSQFPRRTT